MKNLVKIDEKSAENFGQEILPFNHSLANTKLFSEERLAQLLDVIKDLPTRHYILGALDENGFGASWQNGSFENINGEDLLAAIKKGRMWLQIQDLDLIAPEQRAVAEQMFAELQEQVPGFSYSNLRTSILISSPAARVLCHSDCAEVILFHIQGRKRLFIYDGENEEYLPKQVLEGVILKETEEDIPYKREWDKHAAYFDLKPGQAMSWPHFWPHKVDNLSGLNISLQCEYFSNEGRRRFGVRYANGLMRRKAGIIPHSVSHEGPGALMKCGIALMAKKLKVHNAQERKLISTFMVDPDAPGCMRMIDEPDRKVIAK